MTAFLVRRVLQGLLTLFVVSVIVFSLARLTGNPADVLLPIDLTAADRQLFISSLGLDRPVLVQYGLYLQNAARGDFGASVRNRLPVTDLVADRVGNSILLATCVMALTVVISVPLGVIAAVFRKRMLDRIALSAAVVGQAVPSFWTGLIAMQVFAVGLGWLPTSGMGTWQHLVLPSVTSAWFISAGLVRLVRSSMLEVLDAEYVRVARAKGLHEQGVVLRHALPNALIPAVTYFGMMYGLIIGAAITTEVVFSWPGLGRLTYDALLTRDFPLLQLAVLTWTLIVIMINFLVDLAYVAIDPRIRL